MVMEIYTIMILFLLFIALMNFILMHSYLGDLREEHKRFRRRDSKQNFDIVRIEIFMNIDK
jgi:hypothetical protein